MKRTVHLFFVPLVFSLVIMGNLRSNAQIAPLDSLRHLYSQAQHDTLRFEVLISIGDYFEYSEPDSAIAYYRKAEAIANGSQTVPSALKPKYLRMKTKSLRYIGYVYLNQGDYQAATKLYFEALSIAEQLADRTTIYNCYNNIGIINHLQKEYGVAQEYYGKALEITSQAGNRFGTSKLLINMGNLYFDLGDACDSLPQRRAYYQLAQSNYDSSLRIKVELNDFKGQSLCCNNLGNLKKKSIAFHEGISQKMELLAQARAYYEQSASLSSRINDMSGLSMVYGNLSDLYKMLVETGGVSPAEQQTYADSAIFFALKAFDLAKELKSIYLQNEIALLLKGQYAQLKRYDKALEYANIFIDTKDQMFSEEKTKALQEMMTKYETDKKEQEIALQQLTIKKARAQQIVLMLAVGLFGLGIVFMGYIVRLKQKTERILAGKNAELQVMNATKDKFFSIISHDLRTPVSGFKNLLTSMHKTFDLHTPDQIKERIGDLNQSAEETSALLNNLLQWAKSQQNKIEVKKFPVYLKRLINKVTEELSTKSQEKNVSISADVAPDLEVNLDENIVSTVLRNLLSNAIKFSPSGSTVSVNATISADGLGITVTDSGIGMTPQDAEKLFRIECDTKSIGNSPEKGSGLGLIICKELLTLHGGNISVESSLGAGSVFTLRIPNT